MTTERRSEALRLTLQDPQGRTYDVHGSQEWYRIAPLNEPAGPWIAGATNLMWGRIPVNVLEDGTYALAHPETPLVLA